MGEYAGYDKRDPRRYVRLAVHFAKAHARYLHGADFEELTAVCLTAVVEACQSDAYDPARGSITTFIGWRVRAAVSQWSRSESRRGITYIPRKRVGRKRVRCDQLSQCGFPVEMIDPADGFAEVDERDEQAADKARVAGVLSLLPPIWGRVLSETVMGGRTLQEVGEELGLSKERVRQIRNKAECQLRKLVGAGDA